MFVTKMESDEELWRSALTLTKEHHYLDAFSVIKAIAVQTVQSIGGNLSFSNLPTPEEKTLSVAEILYMKALSKQIADCVGKKETDQTAELTTEYLDRFIHLLAKSPVEAEELHKQLLKSLIAPKFAGEKGHSVQTKQSPPFPQSRLIKHEGSIVGAQMKESNKDIYTSSEAAEIGSVSDQTIRRWCEKGKFPEAYQTEGGHWRIPQKYFKVTLHEARVADSYMKKTHVNNKEHFGEDVDEFDIDIDYS